MLRADYQYSTYCRYGTRLLKNAIFIPFYNIKGTLKKFIFDFNKRKCYLDGNLTDRFNFFDWLFSCKGWGYHKGYACSYKKMMKGGFCPNCDPSLSGGNPSFISMWLNRQVKQSNEICRIIYNMETLENESLDKDAVKKDKKRLNDSLSELKNISFQFIPDEVPYNNKNQEEFRYELEEKDAKNMQILTETISFLQYMLSEYFDITLVSPIRRIYPTL